MDYKKYMKVLKLDEAELQSRRLVDEFSLESSPSSGTTVIFVKWASF